MRDLTTSLEHRAKLYDPIFKRIADDEGVTYHREGDSITLDGNEDAAMRALKRMRRVMRVGEIGTHLAAGQD